MIYRIKIFNKVTYLLQPNDMEMNNNRRTVKSNLSFADSTPNQQQMVQQRKMIGSNERAMMTQNYDNSRAAISQNVLPKANVSANAFQ